MYEKCQLNQATNEFCFDFVIINVSWLCISTWLSNQLKTIYNLIHFNYVCANLNSYFLAFLNNLNTTAMHNNGIFPRCVFSFFSFFFLHILKARFFCQASHKMQRDDDKWDCLSTPSLTKAGFIQSYMYVPSTLKTDLIYSGIHNRLWLQ